MDTITLKNNRIIPYTYDLTRDGIIARAGYRELNSEEKQEFTNIIRSERDVVRIIWDAPVCYHCETSIDEYGMCGASDND